MDDRTIPTPEPAGSGALVNGLDDVLITAELASRPSRAPDYEAESRALGLLAQEMAANPRGVLQKCAELVMELCHADSAGISILEPGGTSGVLRWHAAAGAFAPNLHGTMPREASPCGTVMERNCVLLFNEAEEYFPALRGVEPRIYENLLTPWHAEGEATGTLWAIKHTPEGRFDAEDARLLQSLARFAAAAFQMVSALDEATAERSALRASEQRLRDVLDAMDEGFLLAEVVEDEATGLADILFIEANPAAIRIAGRDFRGHRMRDIDPDYEEYWYELYNRVVSTGEALRAEHYAAPHGRWFDFHISRVGDAQSRRVAVVFQDVTDRKRAETALRESEGKYRTLFEEMDEGFALCELVRDSAGRAVDFRYVDLNPAISHHVGIAPQTLRGRRATEAFPDRDPWYLETYAKVVDSGQSVLEEHYFEHVDRWLRLNVFPRGGDRFAVLYSDVTDRNRAETVLRASERRQAFLLRFTDAIRSEPNEQALIERAVRMLAEELAVDRAYATRHYPAQDRTDVVFEARGPGLAPLPATLRFSDFPEAGRQTFERTLIFEDTANDRSLTEADKAALAAMGVGAFLSRPLRRDGSPIFALGVVSTLPRRWTPAEIALVEDATERTWEAAERARAEAKLRDSGQRAKLLLAELQHRVRNVLAIVRSIVGRTHDGERSAEDYVQHLQGRISALARTQAMLTRSPGAGVDLEDMIRGELLAQAARPDQVSLQGPDVELSPKAAEVLSLAVHELATNAVKYGAFSRPGGRLELDWRVEAREGEPWLVLHWRERGVPVVDAAPRRRGFGSELISRRIPYELGGTGSFELKPGGLESRIEFPLRDGDSILRTGGIGP